MVLQSLAGLPAFLAYLCISIVAIVIYVLIYTWLTGHDEFKLIDKGQPGAAVALGLSLIGFALPLASAIAHASNVVDCAIWGVIALGVQIGAYYLASIPVPSLSKRIATGDLAAGLWLGLSSMTAGLLSAASMTW